MEPRRRATLSESFMQRPASPESSAIQAWEKSPTMCSSSVRVSWRSCATRWTWPPVEPRPVLRVWTSCASWHRAFVSSFNCRERRCSSVAVDSSKLFWALASLPAAREAAHSDLVSASSSASVERPSSTALTLCESTESWALSLRIWSSAPARTSPRRRHFSFEPSAPPTTGPSTECSDCRVEAKRCSHCEARLSILLRCSACCCSSVRCHAARTDMLSSAFVSFVGSTLFEWSRGVQATFDASTLVDWSRGVP
mmetsp:Transcript_126672/g.370109  ORF Transcript_126672/g.370109 Transcript_126672/m.370109 type:complete len:254 (+) Transcript_126672:499-1260(+)